MPLAVARRYEDNYATNGDIRIDNVAEDTIGDALEDKGSKRSSYHHTA